MEPIKETIIGLIHSWESRKKDDLAEDPDELLKKILTKKEIGHIKVDYFRKGILGLSVDSSSWLYHLNLRKKQILEGLQKESRNIKEIRLRIGEV